MLLHDDESRNLAFVPVKGLPYLGEEIQSNGEILSQPTKKAKISE